MYRLSFYNLRLLISSLLSSNFCYCNYTNNSVSFPLITEYLPNLEWMYWTLRLACILPMYIFSDYRFMIGIWRAESDTFFLQENQIFHRSILPKKILFTNYIIKKNANCWKTEIYHWRMNDLESRHATLSCMFYAITDISVIIFILFMVCLIIAH